MRWKVADILLQCMAKVQWTKAMWGNGVGCSEKQGLCAWRGTENAPFFGHGWFECGSKCKNSGKQAAHNFWLIRTFCSCVLISDPRNCYQVPPLQETLCHTLGAKHVDERPQREKHESCNDLFGASSQWRLWVSRPHCHGRWKLDCLNHTRKKAAILTLATYWVPRSENFKQMLKAQKIMGTVFCDLKGVICVRFPAESYCETLKKLPRAIHNRRQGVLTSGVCFTTIRNCTPPPIQARYSNSWSGKFFNTLHRVPNLHQVIITCLPTSRNFWLPRTKERSRDKRRSAGMAGRLGEYLVRRRYAKVGPTIRKVPQYTCDCVEKQFNVGNNMLQERCFPKFL